jgi:hypothetical protein
MDYPGSPLSPNTLLGVVGTTIIPYYKYPPIRPYYCIHYLLLTLIMNHEHDVGVPCVKDVLLYIMWSQHKTIDLKQVISYHRVLDCQAYLLLWWTGFCSTQTQWHRLHCRTNSEYQTNFSEATASPVRFPCMSLHMLLLQKKIIVLKHRRNKCVKNV